MWVFDAAPVVIIAYLAWFVWVAQVAGRATWSAPWKALREMSSVDGATTRQTTRYVVWPLAWPLCAAAGVLVMILALGEVSATVLLAPERPPMIVPLLVQWVHLLRSDDMIEGSLMVMGTVMVMALAAVGLVWGTMRV